MLKECKHKWTIRTVKVYDPFFFNDPNPSIPTNELEQDQINNYICKKCGLNLKPSDYKDYLLIKSNSFDTIYKIINTVIVIAALVISIIALNKN